MSRNSRKYTYMVIFLGPAFMLVFVFFFLPVVLDLLLSISDVGADLQFRNFTLKNFYRMWNDRHVLQTLGITAIFVIPTLIFFNVGLAIVLSLMLHSVPDAISAFFRSIWLLPRMAPHVIYAVLWLWMLDPTENGLFNQVLIAMGFEQYDFINSSPVIIIIVTNGIIGCSMGLLIFSAAIKGIPEHLYLAAKVDGASGMATIIKIILPGIKWQLVFVSMYQTISLLITFEVILLITKGGPFYDSTVFALYAYNRAFVSGQYAYGAALALILVVIGIIGSMFLWKVSNVEAMMQEPKIEGY
ncbi:MAG: sugar ABC transporter permease [Proteobacteria bacterium]|nr:sugar ABC transporter permease [Pseudomonadota bacterium]